MKKIILNVGILAMLAMIILPAIRVMAVDDYTLLAPLQDLTSVPGDNPLGKYIPFIFKMLIGLAVVAAVLNIVIGGFQYMSTDAILGKQQGRERIKNAVIALVLIISAWLILATINPNLLNINLSIQPAVTTAPVVGALTPGVKMTTAQITESNAVRTSLETEGVFTYAGPCTQGQTTGCVNLNGLPDSAKDGLVILKNLCAGCSIVITGGTEAGHLTHGVNNPIVDLRLDSKLTDYILKNKKEGPVLTEYGPRYVLEIDGEKTVFLLEDNHWHVVFW